MKRDSDDDDYDASGDLEVIEPENYRGEDIKFSHESDVARALRRVLETGSKEMRAGWWDIKRNRSGEVISQKYHTDTREDFIESVKNFRDILIFESNKKADFKKDITAIEKKMADGYTFWADKEHEWWGALPVKVRMGIEHQQGILNNKQHFIEYYMKEKVEIIRELSRTLHLLVADLKFFKAIEITN